MSMAYSFLWQAGMAFFIVFGIGVAFGWWRG